MTREDIPIDTQREQLEDLKEKKIQTRQTNEFSKKQDGSEGHANK